MEKEKEGRGSQGGHNKYHKLVWIMEKAMATHSRTLAWKIP